MSAKIPTNRPTNRPMSDLLKATGYNCPEDLKGKTFDEAIEGSAVLEDNKTTTITENGTVEITPSAGNDGMKKVTATVNVAGGELNPENLWFHCFTDEWNQLAGFITDKEVLADGVKGVLVCYDGKDPYYKAFVTSAKIVVSNDVVSIENLDPEKDDLPNSPHTYTGTKIRLYSIDFSH